VLAWIIVATCIAVKSSLKNVATPRESDKDVVMKKFLPRIFVHLSTGMRFAIGVHMKRILLLIGLLILTSCAHKAKVNAPSASELFLSERYSYIKGDDGRVFIVTSNTKDFDDAVKKIHLGPSSVDKLNLWVVTPLQPEKKPAH
jgi:hypothetical protein